MTHNNRQPTLEIKATNGLYHCAYRLGQQFQGMGSNPIRFLIFLLAFSSLVLETSAKTGSGSKITQRNTPLLPLTSDQPMLFNPWQPINTCVVRKKMADCHISDFWRSPHQESGIDSWHAIKQLAMSRIKYSFKKRKKHVAERKEQIKNIFLKVIEDVFAHRKDKAFSHWSYFNTVLSSGSNIILHDRVGFTGIARANGGMGWESGLNTIKNNRLLIHIVVTPTSHLDDIKTTIRHEFFHAAQYLFNQRQPTTRRTRPKKGDYRPLFTACRTKSEQKKLQTAVLSEELSDFFQLWKQEKEERTLSKKQRQKRKKEKRTLSKKQRKQLIKYKTAALSYSPPPMTIPIPRDTITSLQEQYDCETPKKLIAYLAAKKAGLSFTINNAKITLYLQQLVPMSKHKFLAIGYPIPDIHDKSMRPEMLYQYIQATNNTPVTIEDINERAADIAGMEFSYIKTFHPQWIEYQKGREATFSASQHNEDVAPPSSSFNR